MKEKGSIRKNLERLGKIWTIGTIPFEVYFLAHGIYLHKAGEALLGAAGLAGDFFTWKLLNRKNNNEMKQEAAQITPMQMVNQRGSERYQNILPFSQPNRLTLVA